MALGNGWSKTWTFFDGDWHEGNVPIMGVRTPRGLARLLGVRRRARLRGRDAGSRSALRAHQRLGASHAAQAAGSARDWMGLVARRA